MSRLDFATQVHRPLQRTIICSSLLLIHVNCENTRPGEAEQCLSFLDRTAFKILLARRCPWFH
jgi:hypothetical protein